jgi:hypothetical protein
VPDLVADAARTLYALPPDDFLRRRGELADAARRDGDPAAAQAITKLRKPTVAAWIVNALVLDDPSIIERLTDLGARLRGAQDALDAAKLRDLSTERRRLVDELCTAAFRKADRAQPPAGLRDEVTGTFDAAIADAEVADRLGALARAEQWSGFGFLPTGAPELTLVQGGRDRPKPRQAPPQPAKARPTAAERRRLERALAGAQRAFDEADAAFDDAQAAERDLTQELRRLIKQLAKLQQRVDDMRTELEQARKDVTATRAQRREARSALDRAEREAAD